MPVWTVVVAVARLLVSSDSKIWLSGSTATVLLVETVVSGASSLIEKVTVAPGPTDGRVHSTTLGSTSGSHRPDEAASS